MFINFSGIIGDFLGIPENPRGDGAGTGTTIWSGVLGEKSQKIPAGTGHSGALSKFWAPSWHILNIFEIKTNQFPAHLFLARM